MATVPRYDDFQVGLTAGPSARLAVPSTPGADALGAEQMQRQGMALQQAGGRMAELQRQAIEEANQVRIDDGLNQLVKGRTDLMTDALRLKGRNALERPDGKALPDEYGEKLQNLADTISSGLGNSAQRKAFGRQAVQLRQQLYSALSSHMVEQQGVYRAQTQKAAIETAIDQAARLGPDEEAFQQSLKAIRGAVFQQVTDSGGDDAVAEATYRQLADKTYGARYKAWQQQDAAAALENFQAHRESIGPLARDQIGDELYRAAQPQLAIKVRPWVEGAGSAPVAAPGGAGMPRGIRNNNPGNIVQTASKWQGEVQGSDPRFKTFATPEAGIKAMGANLLAYQDKYGLNTISSIVSRWAPATENNTGGYISRVSKVLGVKADDKLNLRDPAVMTQLVGAMIGVENRSQPYSGAQIAAGVNAALGKAALPASASQGTAAPEPAWRDADAKTGIPVIDNLSPDQRLRVFQLAQSQMRQDMSQQRESLHSRVQDATAEYMARGAATNPPGEDEFIRAYGQVNGVRRYQELQGTAELGLQLQRAKIAPNADLERMLTESKPAEGGEGFAARQRNYEIMQRAVQITREQRAKDPVAFALSTGAYGLQPINRPDDLVALTTQMSRRAAAASQMASDYGTPPALLANGEAKALAAALRASPVEQQKKMLGTIAQGVGDLGLYKSAMQALAPDMPTVALAGLYQASGYRTTGGRDTADLILRGQAILTPLNAKEDGSGHMGGKSLLKMPPDKDMLSTWNDVTGKVFADSEGAADLYMQSARAIYAARSVEDGDYSGEFKLARWEAAIKLATGGIESHNGAKIVMPYGKPYDQFRDYINYTAPAAIKAAGGKFNVHGMAFSAAELAKTLPGATLINRDSGSYMVQAGTDVVRNADGSPYILKVPR